jgi:hypothetical protein
VSEEFTWFSKKVDGVSSELTGEKLYKEINKKTNDTSNLQLTTMYKKKANKQTTKKIVLETELTILPIEQIPNLITPETITYYYY